MLVETERTNITARDLEITALWYSSGNLVKTEYNTDLPYAYTAPTSFCSIRAYLFTGSYYTTIYNYPIFAYSNFWYVGTNISEGKAYLPITLENLYSYDRAAYFKFNFATNHIRTMYCKFYAGPSKLTVGDLQAQLGTNYTVKFSQFKVIDP